MNGVFYKFIALSRGESLHHTHRIFTLTLCMILIICNNSNNEFEERKRLLTFNMQSLFQNENIGSKWRIWRLEISQNKSITYLRWIAVCDVEFKNKTSTNTRIPTWLNCTWVFFQCLIPSCLCPAKLWLYCSISQSSSSTPAPQKHSWYSPCLEPFLSALYILGSHFLKCQVTR